MWAHRQLPRTINSPFLNDFVFAVLWGFFSLPVPFFRQQNPLFLGSIGGGSSNKDVIQSFLLIFQTLKCTCESQPDGKIWAAGVCASVAIHNQEFRIPDAEKIQRKTHERNSSLCTLLNNPSEMGQEWCGKRKFNLCYFEFLNEHLHNFDCSKRKT